jgi:hypothetical protein
MKQRAGKVIVAVCVLGVVGGVAVYLVGRCGAAAQALPGSVGRFRVGAELGRERAGVSGRAMLEGIRRFLQREHPDRRQGQPPLTLGLE